MNKALILLNIIVLIITVIWMKDSSFQYNSIVATGTFTISLIGLIFGKNLLSSSNKVTIKGNKNKAIQNSNSSTLGINKSNEALIEGDENEINQQS